MDMAIAGHEWLSQEWKNTFGLICSNQGDVKFFVAGTDCKTGSN
jgi:hypothetical protein